MELEKLKILFYLKFKDFRWNELKNFLGKKWKILFVDDEKSYRDMVADVLDKTSMFDVFSAGNGLEAIEIYKKDVSDLVISDIMMDTMTGVELAGRILRINEDAKVIFLSGWLGKEAIYDKFPSLFDNGSFEFLDKPVDVNYLINKTFLMLNPSYNKMVINTIERDEVKDLVRDLEFNVLIILYKEMRELFIDLSRRLLDKSLDQSSLDSILFPIKDYINEKGCKYDESFCRSNLCARVDEDCAREKISRYILQLSNNLKFIFKTTAKGEEF
ncbi:MAG: response regulator [Candidatus Delongbacteria bacterium]|nr:response regulator [Candidatus Delongbacteria bacterium]MBN2833987.1 response regulator [Candidatus Delongbacteria bacterium]